MQENPQHLKAFQAACEKSLPRGHYSFSPVPIERTALNGSQRKILGTLLPQTADEVRNIILLANEYTIPVYVVSRGENWGFGANLPVKNSCVVCNLKHMNKIIEVNEDHGYAVIEAGVSQGELSSYLKSINSQFYIDTTGSTINSSLLGNALERGISYESMRVSQISNLEVVTGKGDFLRTGFGCMKSAGNIKNLYKFGIGPSLDGLFFQSNFGVVTSATIRLRRYPETSRNFFFRIKNRAALAETIEKLSQMKARGHIRHIPNFFSRNKMKRNIESLINSIANIDSVDIKRKKIENFVDKLLSEFQWFGVVVIAGDKHDVKYASKLIYTAACKGVEIVSYSMLNKIIPFVSKLPNPMYKYLCKALNFTLDSFHGFPRDEFFWEIFWTNYSEVGHLDRLDNNTAGLILITVLLPQSKSSTEYLTEFYMNLSKKNLREVGLGLNITSGDLTEGVISIYFDRSTELSTDKAKKVASSAYIELMEKGYPPYRLDIENMRIVTCENKQYWNSIASLKDLFDPNNILSPERYCIK